LIRFFRREIAEHLLSNKKMLKGKSVAIFEDQPQLNMNLIFKLSKRAEVERAWNMGGQVWVKLHSSPRKFKVSINDKINDIVKPRHTALRIHTSPSTTSTTQQDVTTHSSPSTNSSGEQIVVPTNPPPYTQDEPVQDGPIVEPQVHPILESSSVGIPIHTVQETLIQA
jgi:hypothetical protein